MRNAWPAKMLIGLALVGASLYIYRLTLQHDFVWDSVWYLRYNEYWLTSLRPEHLVWMTVSMPLSNWHPLTWLSWAFDYQLYGGLAPRGFHLTNNLLHAFNSVGVFALLYLLLRLPRQLGSRAARGPALAASGLSALLFALHPQHVESVAWVAQRKDLLFQLFALFLTMLLAVLLGMGMPAVPAYINVALLMGPMLVGLGLATFTAHMFIFYFGLMSMITPPVAIAAFAAASLSGAKPMETGATAVRLGWIAYVIPFVFVLSPSLLGQGDASDIIMTTVTAFMGVWISSCGLIGYMFGPLSALYRLLFFTSGILLLLPAEAIPHGLALNGAGLVLGILLLSRDYMSNRHRRASEAASGGAGE